MTESSSPTSLFRRVLQAVRARYRNRFALKNSGLNKQRHRVWLDASTFDLAYYLEHNPDVAESGRDPFEHFLEHGVYEDRKARFFDTSWYLKRYPDLLHGHLEAFSHFRQYGHSEGRSAQFISLKTSLVRPPAGNYGDWVRQFDEPNEASVKWMEKRAAELKGHTFGVLVIDAGLRADSVSLVATFQSVFAQVLPPSAVHLVAHMHTFRARDAVAQLGKKGTEIVCHDIDDHLADALNSAIDLMAADFVVIVDGGDILNARALFCLAEALEDTPDAEILYSDEDCVDASGKRFAPYFKCKPNPELLLTHNMLGNLVAYKTSLLHLIQGFDSHHDGAAEYDLALRAVESTAPDMIVHIPRVLYHRLTTDDTAAHNPSGAHQDAVRSYLNRRNLEGNVMPAPEVPGYNRVRLTFKGKAPRVSIIIPTRDRLDILKVCLTSLIERTTYRNTEILVVDNGSEEPETLAYLKQMEVRHGVVVMRDPRPFNFSALNNAAIERAQGEFVCLMNNDIEIITPDWLEEMLSFAQNPDVGCVGARLWYPDGTLQHGGVLIGFHGAAGHMHKYLKKGETGYANRAVLHQSLSAVTAACLLVRKSIYQEVGGMDEAFAVAFNDVDLCLKIREAGYRNVYTPYAEMIHHESASRGQHATPESVVRELEEVNLLKTRWGGKLLDDPAYNPNLTLTFEDLSLAWPPRVRTLAP